MTDTSSKRKSDPPGGPIAPLRNVALMLGLIQQLRDRKAHLPGLGCFYGYSGFGKTVAATYAQNKEGAIRVEARDTWTRRSFLVAVMKELGVNEPRGTVDDLFEAVVVRLAVPDHPPLLIDEADAIVDKKFIETVRHIHEAAHVPIILIGEEALPTKLAVSERSHNRVLSWVAAQPCDFDDARKLATWFHPHLTIADALLRDVLVKSGGRARRICVNLEKIEEWSLVHGAHVIDEADYDGGFDTGQPPVRQARRS